MITEFQTHFRVSYSDTDQMGYMHHSYYLKYYETARWELFRDIGIPYAGLEKDGLILPVIDASLKYIRPAFYDQLLKITTILDAQKGARFIFRYRTENEAGEIINEARITVACVKKSTGKACMLPSKITGKLRECGMM